MIQRLSSENIPFVARLHQSALEGFLSSLGTQFLETFYRLSLQLPDVFTLIAAERGQIVGFASGAERIPGLLRRVILRKPLWFILFFLKYFSAHQKSIIPAMQTLMYPGFSGDEPELLSFTVEKNQRGKGIGKKLFFACAEEFKRRGHTSFLISVYDRLPANGFYEKMGCRLIRSFEFHGEKMNYYRYHIE